jgi:aspartokinase/homoserine dehydrogenase 1
LFYASSILKGDEQMLEKLEIDGAVEEGRSNGRRSAPSASGGSISSGRPTLVMKFGGSVLTSADRILRAAALVRDATSTARVAVTVSAMGGVTDKLLDVARSLRLRSIESATAEVREICRFHDAVVQGLALGSREEDELRSQVDALGAELERLVAQNEAASTTLEVAASIVSFGERWSSRLFAAALRTMAIRTQSVDSFHFLITNAEFHNAELLFEESWTRTRETLLPLLEDSIAPVITGFLGATADGRITTLGRNSSDLSAAFFACALQAQEMTIWTSVDGIFNADPKRSANADWLPRLSYLEALGLSRDGAKVVHPKVLEVLAEHGIPLRVRSALRPELPGTWVGELAKGASA